MIRRLLPTIAFSGLCFVFTSGVWSQSSLSLIEVSEDGSHFVNADTGEKFVIWGVNYDHDGSGDLLDEYWLDRWETVVEDFAEIKDLGANCVRIHLQFGVFMESPTEPNAESLEQLGKLVKLAEDNGLYLDITGLACYHKKNIPAWYDALDESERWEAQAKFWEAIAKTCRESPAVFCYDLMNEPVLAGKEPETEWLTGELGGKFFVQRLTLDLAGRSRADVAEAWSAKMTESIRKHDERHMITVGVIPWVFVFGGGKPLFYSPPVAKHFDFVSIHVYPTKGEVDKAVDALPAYDVGKPLIIEEMFPLKCSQEELVEFIERSSDRVDGWVSFYWGQTSDELESKPDKTIGDAITAVWLERFRELSEQQLSRRD